MIEFWRKTNDKAVCIGELPDTDATYEKALMGLDEVKITVVVSQPLDIRVKDYILLDGMAYTLNREPDLLKASELEYRYELVFESPAYNLMDKLYRYPQTGQSRFTLTGRLADFVDILLQNINQEEFDPGWEKDTDGNGNPRIIETEFKNLNFDSVSCYEVLTKLADEFAVEYRITGRKIAFEERVERIRDLKFEQGCGHGLYTLRRQNADTENTVTRAYVFGSRENLPLNYRDRKYDRLVPADADGKLIPYFENTAEYTKIVERDVFFDDVKPVFTGSPDSVSGTNNQVIGCRAIDFDLNDKAVAIGDQARINFLTGDLMGIGFKFSYNLARREITLVTQEDETAAAGGDPELAVVPNRNRKPAVTDKFNFTGIYLPDSYVTAAEQRLAEKGRKWMEVYARLRVKYNLDVDYHYLRELGETLEVGDVVRIVVPDGSEQQLRITSLKKQLATGQLTCEVMNFLTESWEKKLEGRIIQARSSVEISKSEVEYSINATRDWVGRNFGQLSEKMTDGEAIVWDEEAHRIRTAAQVPDAVLWDGLRVPDWLDQQVRTTDRVVFQKVTAEEFTEGGEEQVRVVSEGEELPDAPSALLTESGGGMWDLTIGSLENVSELADSAEDGCVLMKKGDIYVPVKLESAGGGTGGITMRLKSLSGSVLSGIAGGVVNIGYQFTSVYADDGVETGPGTAIYTVNAMTVATRTVGQGEVYFDVSPWLTAGTNRVNVVVTDSTGLSHTLNYTVELVQMSLSSTFDALQVFTGRISYRYVPVGALEKTIHFVWDGRELEPVVSNASNRQMTYDIPAQPHGNHTLQVYMTAVVNGTEVRSNTLSYDLICVEQGQQMPVIASAFSQQDAEQYQTVNIPFVVFDPAASTTEITLEVNGNILATQTVDRTLQTWNYRLDGMGSLELIIRCRTTVKRFLLSVTPSSVVAVPETRGLELFLTSANRSNNDQNKEQWSFGEIQASLTDFNYKTNGWVAGLDGSVALRISGDARVRIPFRIFGRDFRSGGKTVEFEFATTGVTDYDTPVIECMNGGIGLQITAQNALFASEQTRVDTQFKENERVRVSFVVEDRAENRLVYTYINGIISGIAQYPAEDNFMQRNPADIVIGSNDCTVDVYNIRVYENKLTQYQMLDNYIGDMDRYDQKLEVYARNQIFNDYGDVMYTAVLEQLPCMILTGDLPGYKGDKKTIAVVYTDQQHPERSFTSEKVQIDVQGTSSQYYPRKNYKTKHKGGFRMTATGETVAKFALRDGEIPVDTFCEKADFAESSGTHNTGMAKLVHSMLRQLNSLTPPQKADSRARTTVDGFPIAVFHRSTATDGLTFVGKYNFNNDKSTQETFGFEGAAECWEVCNNTSDRTLFKVSDYSSDEWQNDFEGRYPDGGTDYTHLKELTDWLVSTQGDPDKFRREAEEHFNKPFLLFYYLMTELFAMVDQRAKNMMLASWGNEGSGACKWYPIFYDSDTICGVNNEGAMAFSYNVEYHDAIGTQQVFNGEQSVLWNQVEQCFAVEIAELYYRMRSGGILTFEKAVEMFNREQSDKWCEAIYNMDCQFKYIDPLLLEGNASYLYAAQGSRKEHRTWWLYNRFRYMDSKYTAGEFLSDYVTMRLYTPASYAGVEPDANFRIVPFADQYVRVKYGSYMVGQRSYKDREILLEAPAIQFNDTETIIYGASGLKSLGDLSGKYAGTIDVSKAVKLKELQIGSGVEGYQNTNLTTLSVGNNKMLRTLDVRNCPNLRQAVDLSGCENLERIYAQGTNITSVVLPEAGILSQLRLPGSVTNLTIKNQPKLTDAGFSIDGVDKLTTLRLENMDGVNVFGLIERCTAVDPVVLSRVRLTGIRGTFRDTIGFSFLTQFHGIDENGNNTEKAIVQGKCHINYCYLGEYEQIVEAFPELEVSYDYYCIRFADPVVKSILIGKFDQNGNGELDKIEVEGVTSISDLFVGKIQMETFDEFKYFIHTQSQIDASFMGCTSLRSISLPKLFLAERGSSMFSGCVSLVKVEIPEDVTRLPGNMFVGCTALKTVKLPPAVKELVNTFKDSGVEYIEIGDGTEILQGTFDGSQLVRTVIIGKGIKTIKMGTFRNCSVLRNLVIKAEVVPVMEYFAIGGTTNDSGFQIYVPDASVAAYKAADVWKGLAAKIKPLSEYVND